MNKLTLVLASVALTAAGGSVAQADDSGRLSMKTLETRQRAQHEHVSASTLAMRDSTGARDRRLTRAVHRSRYVRQAGPHGYNYGYGPAYSYGYGPAYGYGYGSAYGGYGDGPVYNYGYGPVAPVGPLGIVAPVVNAPFAAAEAIFGGPYAGYPAYTGYAGYSAWAGQGPGDTWEAPHYLTWSGDPYERFSRGR
jgi:hypothetical protein